MLKRVAAALAPLLVFPGLSARPAGGRVIYVQSGPNANPPRQRLYVRYD